MGTFSLLECGDTLQVQCFRINKITPLESGAGIFVQLDGMLIKAVQTFSSVNAERRRQAASLQNLARVISYLAICRIVSL